MIMVAIALGSLSLVISLMALFMASSVRDKCYSWRVISLRHLASFEKRLDSEVLRVRELESPAVRELDAERCPPAGGWVVNNHAGNDLLIEPQGTGDAFIVQSLIHSVERGPNILEDRRTELMEWLGIEPGE